LFVINFDIIWILLGRLQICGAIRAASNTLYALNIEYPSPCGLPHHSQDAVALVRSIEDPEQAAKKLTEEAYGRGSMDNISCIVVRFKH
jgi:hypothetical protein